MTAASAPRSIPDWMAGLRHCHSCRAPAARTGGAGTIWRWRNNESTRGTMPWLSVASPMVPVQHPRSVATHDDRGRRGRSLSTCTNGDDGVLQLLPDGYYVGALDFKGEGNRWTLLRHATLENTF